MAEHIIGGLTYTDDFVVEQDGDLYGPFGGSVAAAAFAFKNLEFPWTVRQIFKVKE